MSARLQKQDLERRVLPVALSALIHVLILIALVQARPEPPKLVEPRLMTLTLVEPLPPAQVLAPLPPAPPSAAPPSEAPPAPTKPKPRLNVFRKTLAPPPDVEPLPAGDGPTAESVEVSDAALAGAGTAGSGPPGGGACNMTRRLQNALRKDRLVQAAVASAHRGRALMVWNGDWVRHPGQEGNGLAAVREAIMWEVGFAPEACRTERVHGLIVVSLNDGPGSPRLVVGAGDWRWSDLLFVR